MIQVYSKQNCSRCTDAKSLLSKYDIPFEEIQVDKDPNALTFLKSAGHRSVPQLYVNNKVLVKDGYSDLSKLSKVAILNKVEELNG